MSDTTSPTLAAGQPWTSDAPVRSTQVWLPPGMVHFGIGQPDFHLLSLDLMRRAADHRLAQPNPYLLNYGSEQGDGYFRLALAAFLGHHYAQPVDAGHLVLTAGASHGLDLICTLFARSGDTILVEEPSYFLALRIFEDHGLRVVSLPADDDGLVVDALPEALAAHNPAFLYTIPTFQNPTGVTLTQARRQRLADIAREHNLLIVADEVYHLLDYTQSPHMLRPAPLALHAHHAPILSLGSFSKILAPGLRLGWIHGTPALVEKLALCGLLDSGGSPAHFTSGLVRSVLELDLLNPYLRDLKRTYAARARALSAALCAQIPEVRFHDAQGGFFLWLTLPQHIDTVDLLPVAESLQVGYVPGSRFSSRDGLRNALRLSFAFHDIPALELGVTRLRQALDAYASR
jgi:2-aminoadipate transaminase